MIEEHIIYSKDVMNGHILNLRKRCCPLIERLTDANKVVDLAPFLWIEPKLSVVMLHAVSLKDCTAAPRTL